VSDPGSEPPPPPPPPDLAPPPGYVGYTERPTRSRRITSIRNAILIVLVLVAVSGVVQLAATPGLVDKSKDFLAGRITESKYKDDLGTGAAGILVLLPLVATIVLSIIWLYLIIRDHVEFGRRLTWGPGWAIGGWFLPPGILYVIPMLVLRETWKAADPRYGPGEEGWRSGATHPALWVWWALYGIAPIVFIVVGLRSTIGNIGASTKDIAKSFVDNAGAMYVQGVVSLLAVLAWAAVVWLWTDRHNRLGATATAIA
jgi:hypothetical protein